MTHFRFWQGNVSPLLGPSLKYATLTHFRLFRPFEAIFAKYFFHPLYSFYSFIFDRLIFLNSKKPCVRCPLFGQTTVYPQKYFITVWYKCTKLTYLIKNKNKMWLPMIEGNKTIIAATVQKTKLNPVFSGPRLS